MGGASDSREKVLKRIKKALGKSGITNGDDINKLAKQLFGDRFIGIFVIKGQSSVPTLKEGQIAILNKDVHWYAIFKKDGKLYETDSYGRDLLGPKYKDKLPPKSFIQGNGGVDNQDCGQRALTSLIFDAL